MTSERGDADVAVLTDFSDKAAADEPLLVRRPLRGAQQFRTGVGSFASQGGAR